MKGEPRVLHGHTLTKGASLREICYAIRDSAFITSDLPVIVSFEVHANLEQQQIMVDIINEAWKDLLVKVPSDVKPEKLPALGELKRKILIKTKSTPAKSTEEKVEVLENVKKPSEQPAQGQAQKPSKPSKILEALAKMAVYTRAYHFSHFDQPGMARPQVNLHQETDHSQRPNLHCTSSPSPRRQHARHTLPTATHFSNTTGHP
jgi:hypothetical protein